MARFNARDITMRWNAETNAHDVFYDGTAVARLIQLRNTNGKDSHIIGVELSFDGSPIAGRPGLNELRLLLIKQMTSVLRVNGFPAMHIGSSLRHGQVQNVKFVLVEQGDLAHCDAFQKFMRLSFLFFDFGNAVKSVGLTLPFTVGTAEQLQFTEAERVRLAFPTNRRQLQSGANRFTGFILDWARRANARKEKNPDINIDTQDVQLIKVDKDREFPGEKPCNFCRSDILHKQTILNFGILNVIMNYSPFDREHPHIMIIPTNHVERFEELSAKQLELLGILMRLYGEAIHSICPELPSEEITLLVQQAFRAGQTVPHLHIHLLPRPNQDRFNENQFNQVYHPKKRVIFSGSQMQAIAEKYRALLVDGLNELYMPNPTGVQTLLCKPTVNTGDPLNGITSAKDRLNATLFKSESRRRSRSRARPGVVDPLLMPKTLPPITVDCGRVSRVR